MCSHHRLAARLGLTVLLSVTGAACAVQYRDASGSVRVLGTGAAEDVAHDGSVRRTWLAGVGIRAVDVAGGLSLGWHETTFFMPETDGPRWPPAAIQLESYGVDVGSGFVVLGYHRDFVVAAPPPQASMIQVLRYSDRDPGASRAWKEVVP